MDSAKNELADLMIFMRKFVTVIDCARSVDYSFHVDGYNIIN